MCDTLATMTWPVAFILTLLTELPVAILLTPAAHRRRLLPWMLIANATSHPALWAAWPVLSELCGDYTTTLFAGEALVYSYEALIFSLALRSPRGILISVGANTASMIVGLIISAAIG